MWVSRFDPKAPHISIWVRIWGPRGVEWCEMALDTGTSRTVVERSILERLGYDLTGAPTTTVVTASEVTEAVRVVTRQIHALGTRRDNLPMLAMALPATLRTSGMIGLDFLRGLCLLCDFRKGKLTLFPSPRSFWARFICLVRLWAAL